MKYERKLLGVFGVGEVGAACDKWLWIEAVIHLSFRTYDSWPEYESVMGSHCRLFVC